MIFRPAVTDLDRHDVTHYNGEEKPRTIPPRGTLADFEMAVELGPDGNARPHVKFHYYTTGNLPFMARDLVSHVCNGRLGGAAKASLHFYRYDLESFYYVLIWAAITYRLPTPGRSRKTHARRIMKINPLEHWLSPDPKTVYASKLLLHSGSLFEDLSDGVSKEWKDLWDNWVRPLNLMFGDGHSATDIAQRRGNANFDAATCDGLITFEKFMDTINKTPRGLNPSVV